MSDSPSNLQALRDLLATWQERSHIMLGQIGHKSHIVTGCVDELAPLVEVLAQELETAMTERDTAVTFSRDSAQAYLGRLHGYQVAVEQVTQQVAAALQEVERLTEELGATKAFYGDANPTVSSSLHVELCDAKSSRSYRTSGGSGGLPRGDGVSDPSRSTTATEDWTPSPDGRIDLRVTPTCADIFLNRVAAEDLIRGLQFCLGTTWPPTRILLTVQDMGDGRVGVQFATDDPVGGTC